MNKKYRIVCTWPQEEWLVQERIEKTDHTADWMTAHHCIGKRWDGYNEAKQWLKENDK